PDHDVDGVPRRFGRTHDFRPQPRPGDGAPAAGDAHPILDGQRGARHHPGHQKRGHSCNQRPGSYRRHISAASGGAIMKRYDIFKVMADLLRPEDLVVLWSGGKRNEWLTAWQNLRPGDGTMRLFMMGATSP